MRFSLALSAIAALSVAGAQSPITVPLAGSGWDATDSLRIEEHLGRPSLYINKGVALAKGVELQDGTLEYDVAAAATSSFLGVTFRSKDLQSTEVLFFRPDDSGTAEAVQYGPAFHGVVAAWQIYHGPGANAVAQIPRERWFHVRVELEGPSASVYVDTATRPTLIIPLLAGTGGSRVGVWAGAYGRGAWYSNITYVARQSAAHPAAPAMPVGTIADWELSQAIPAAEFTPDTLPNLSAMHWERVHAELNGVVLVSRYRAGPIAAVPREAGTRRVLDDSVMTGKIAGSQVVYARTTIDAPKAQRMLLSYGYSDGIVIYLNGAPLLFAMSPQNFRNQGVMERMGDAVYLPLRAGKNEVVFAIPEVGGGWGFWARVIR